MGFEHLKLFRDVVQLKSVSRGASMNRVSQSAASQHIQDMEEKLGTALLDRSTRPFTLTPAGKLYFDLCRDVLRRKEEFDVELERIKGAVEGAVRVASIYSVGLSDMSHLQEEFARRYPQARLEVEYLRPDKVYESVLADQVDLGLVSYAESSRQLAARPWRNEHMVIAAPPGHRLAGRKQVAAREVSGEDFVAFDEDLPIRRKIDYYLRDAGVEVRVIMHFDNIQMIKEAVALGSGISILPERAMRLEIEHGRIVRIPLDKPLVRPLGIIHNRRKKFNRATQCFLELLEKQHTAEPEPTIQAR